MKKHIKMLVALVAVVAMAIGLFAGCGSSSSSSSTSASGESGSSDGATITVAMVNNVCTNGLADRIDQYDGDGVTVVCDVLTEEDLRTKVTNMVSTGDATYDIYMCGGYETTIWKDNGWMLDISDLMENAPNADTYDYDDIFEGIAGFGQGDNGEIYALPFYGESSYLMYNKEMFEKAGIEAGDKCTIEDIQEWAAKLNDPDNGVYGFIARGNVGWGSVGAPFGTFVNYFGASYYDSDWNANFDTDEMRTAFKTYADLCTQYGPKDVTNCSYNDCIGYMTSGQGAMWYDATSNGQNVDTDDSVMQDNTGYCLIDNTDWIWEWVFCVNPKTENAQACVDFMMWATSKDYVDLTMADDPTGMETPSGVRASTYERDDYSQLSYAQPTLDALDNAVYGPKNGSPYDEVQFAVIPEFQDLGDYMTEQLSAYMTGSATLDEAIDNCNEYFNQVAKDSGYQE